MSSPGLARVQLQLGLLAQLRPAVRVDPGRHRLGGRAPERGERRDPGVGELLDLRPVEPGDAAEVVDASQYASQSALKSQMPQWSTG